jgi:hypothetical protein
MAFAGIGGWHASPIANGRFMALLQGAVKPEMQGRLFLRGESFISTPGKAVAAL